MLDRYLTTAFELWKNNPKEGAFSDSIDNYEYDSELKGHIISGMGKLNANEINSGKRGFAITHRLYTRSQDVRYGDIIKYDGDRYNVISISNKSNPLSSINFYQIDLEVVV